MDEEALQATIRAYQQLLANAQDSAIRAEVLLEQSERKLRVATERIKELDPEQPHPANDGD